MNERVIAAISKLEEIKRCLNQVFLEREEAIDNILLALASKNHVVLLGPPGTAKSMLAREIYRYIQDENAKYFEWLLHAMSDPAEVLGPYSIKKMEEDKFMRIYDGKLPAAFIAFIDEIFKSNGELLNALLSITNERLFYNDGEVVNVPLHTLIGASNEEPADDALCAFYDRIVFRIPVNYIRDDKNRKKMLRRSILERQKGNDTFLHPPVSISISELNALYEYVRMKVNVSDDIIDMFLKIIVNLEKEGIIVSDRRQNACFEILQAAAALNGRSDVQPQDLMSLKYVLWQRQEDISVITSVLEPYEEQIGKEITTLYRCMDEFFHRLGTADTEMEKKMMALEIDNDMKLMIKQVVHLRKLYGNDKRLIALQEAIQSGQEKLLCNEFQMNMDGVKVLDLNHLSFSK